MTQTSVHSTAHDWLFLVRSICHWDWTHSSLASGSWQTSSHIPCQIKILNPSSLVTHGKTTSARHKISWKGVFFFACRISPFESPQLGMCSTYGSETKTKHVTLSENNVTTTWLCQCRLRALTRKRILLNFACLWLWPPCGQSWLQISSNAVRGYLCYLLKIAVKPKESKAWWLISHIYPIYIHL